jgi:hypothetical protein
MFEENFQILQLDQCNRMDSLIEIVMDIRNSNNPSSFHIENQQIKDWSKNSNNLFLVCKYKDIVTALFFSLRLKPDIFKKLINFDVKLSELRSNHFSNFDENASHYIIAFFALNRKSASILFSQYYTHLIENQQNILSIGASTAIDDAQKIVTNMNLKLVKKYRSENKVVTTYEAPLTQVFTSKNALKIVFNQDYSTFARF